MRLASRIQALAGGLSYGAVFGPFWPKLIVTSVDVCVFEPPPGGTTNFFNIGCLTFIDRPAMTDAGFAGGQSVFESDSLSADGIPLLQIPLAVVIPFRLGFRMDTARWIGIYVDTGVISAFGHAVVGVSKAIRM